MFGKKIGKQKIYISAINGPSLPPKPLEYRCRAFCCAELPLLVTPVWGKKENRKIFISVIKGQKSMPRIRVSIDVALIGPPHLHCQTE